MSESPSRTCANCGVPQPDLYCAYCGEKRISRHDFSLGHFLEDAFEHLSHFDFRSWRAFRKLVMTPGALTRDYLDGRRKGQSGPIQLFVIVNVVFAVLIGFTGWRPLNTPLRVQLHDPPFVELKRERTDAARERKGLAKEEFAREFDAEANVASKEWVFAMIPVFACLMALLYGFRRYFYEHLIFATHFYAFVLIALLGFAMSYDYLLAPAARAWTFPVQGESLSAIVLESAIWMYLSLALRRVYGDNWFAAVLRAGTLSLFFIPLLQLYRFLLFFVTLRSMR